MSKIKGLGYIGCEVTDFDAWDSLLDTVYGLEQRADSGKSLRHYRMDDNHHRLALHKSNSNKLKYIGWEVEFQGDLDNLAAELSDKGIAVEAGSAALREERAVMDLFVVSGPDDIRLEIFFGPVQDCKPFTPKRGMEGYNTGDLGMGHIVLATADRPASVKWYEDNLGFRLSDHIFWDGIQATFLHCNPRHHSLAFMNPVGGMKPGDLGHFMFESLSLNDVGRAYDIVHEHKVPLALTLGRHSNDHMMSFYIYSPSGWWIEYGHGARLIDDAEWEPKFYSSPKIWGHEMLPPPGEAVAGEQHKR
ncbi:MAG: VOC family protein [Gammaproteobacteria bacterium]|nr:VOC family protein [Gammaproteobacteria bacterium]